MIKRFNTGLMFEMVRDTWERAILPALADFILIPNVSPHYDPEWREKGHMGRAVMLIVNWCAGRMLLDLQVEVITLPNRTPLLCIEVPAYGSPAPAGTILMYGHLDKQPESTGWHEGLGPWQPVRDGDRLYGRGSADDGYAPFAALTALEVLQRQGVPHARCVMLFECGEESGSPDLPAYIEHLAERIGIPELMICLDSGCGDYEHLWVTTSLRGVVSGTLSVEVMTESVHSGHASGIIPDPSRIIAAQIARLEDLNTGRVASPRFCVTPPRERILQAQSTAQVLGQQVFEEFPVVRGFEPTTADLTALILRNTWEPALTRIGVEGLPAFKDASPTMPPRVAMKLSLRIPPGIDPETAASEMKRVLELEPPCNVHVSFEGAGAPGWAAPPTAAWLAQSLECASDTFFDAPPLFKGQGGTIPFMHLLGEKFPSMQFLVVGVLGPESNAHGPNEFLEISMAKKLTACIAQVVAAHAAR